MCTRSAKIELLSNKMIGRLYPRYIGLQHRRQALRLRRTAARLRGLTAVLSRRTGIDADECDPLPEQEGYFWVVL